MMRFLLAYNAEDTKEPCSLCGRPASTAGGVRLVRADNTASVCQECGGKQAPELVALANLAGAATRIGRIHRHSVFPPLTALLDLANAAEKYAHTSSP